MSEKFAIQKGYGNFTHSAHNAIHGRAGGFLNREYFRHQDKSSQNFRNIFDPLYEHRDNLRGKPRPGLTSATMQTGYTPEEYYFRMISQYEQHGDADAAADVIHERAETLLSNYGSSRDFVERPWRARFR